MTANAKPSMANYNRAVKSARAATTKTDTANWIVGDAALTVAAEYGENTIKRFSDDIGQEVTSVRNMRTISGYYPAGKITRDLQSWTVYAVFGSQDDRFELVTNGNDGQRWSVSAARALVKARKDAQIPVPDADPNADADADKTPAADELAIARAEVDRLRGELAKAETKVRKIELARGITPDKPQHNVRGIPAHAAEDNRADCPTCQANAKHAADANVTPLQPARRSRSRRNAA